ncbi:cupin domain-containing protein [Oryzibacter oryziterrae]|uniref:cupin domain-containing protein n=1 Tax=Oryzibacter oryziterrae TaxID=2766474 RepID=UPI001F1D0FE3|nr:cupin domain-containing protein [Oryzibacter oryziterrae]
MPTASELLVTLETAPTFPAKDGLPLPERLIAGAPTFKTWALDEAKDGKVLTGIWLATPGETRSIKGEVFEFCYILDGLVEITPDGGVPVTYRAGDSFLMKPGFTGVWKTVETVRKIYVVVN